MTSAKQSKKEVSGRNSEQSEVGKVIPYARIEALQDIYAGGGKAGNNIIEAEFQKKLGDIVEQWVVEQCCQDTAGVQIHHAIG